MKSYRHKVGNLYKPYKGSYSRYGSRPLVFVLVRKLKKHYCLKCVGDVEKMIEIAGPCMTPHPDGLIWAKKVGEGRLFFHYYDEVRDLEDYYECYLTGIKEKLQ